MSVKLTHPSFHSSDPVGRYLSLLCSELEQILIRLNTMCGEERIRAIATSKEGEVPHLIGKGTSDLAIDTELSDYFFTKSRGYRTVVYKPCYEHSLLGGKDILVECFLTDSVGWQRVLRVDGDGCDIYLRGYTEESGWSEWSVR